MAAFLCRFSARGFSCVPPDRVSHCLRDGCIPFRCRDNCFPILFQTNFTRKYEFQCNYNNYRISVDFVIDDYDKYKESLVNPTIKKYDTFELIQHKTNNSIINIISLSAKEDYKIKE